jgi:hypothetical protein
MRFYACGEPYDTPCLFSEETLGRLLDRGWGDKRCVRHGALVDTLYPIEADSKKDARSQMAEEAK